MVFKEVEFYNPLYVATLDNGITLFVYDGYAHGSDGKNYIPVEKQIGDDFEFIGWEEK